MVGLGSHQPASPTEGGSGAAASRVGGCMVMGGGGGYVYISMYRKRRDSSNTVLYIFIPIYKWSSVGRDAF